MRNLTRICALLAVLALPGAAASYDYEIDTAGRVVAFADVHGAYDELVALLREVGVVDAALNWAGGTTTLVSLGDLVGRGPHSRKVLELLMRLEQQAAAAGGGVHMVLGNHEVMVMTGDLRDTSPGEFAAFAGEESAAQREALYADYRHFNPGGDEVAARRRFDEKFPAGFAALRRAFSREGALGRWLARRPFAMRINDKVYVHGGIASVASGYSIAGLNEQLQNEFRQYLASMEALRGAGVLPWFVDYYDKLAFLSARVEEFTATNPGATPGWFAPLRVAFDAQHFLLFDEYDSPTGYRGSARCPAYAESFNTERFLKRAGARQLVLGHEPSRGEVYQRMEGMVIRLDSGMLNSVYGGRASALVSQGGVDYVHYAGRAERAQPVALTTSLSRELSGLGDAELEDFLRTAPVISIQELGTGVAGPKRVTQRRGGIVNEAVFRSVDSDPGLEGRAKYARRRYNDSSRYVYDVAAYKLDRMLGLEMVPAAVVAEVEGRQGALSDRVENAISERDRQAQEIPFRGYCKQQEQYRLRFVFDILIHNDGRNLANILWSRDDFMLRLIDHTLAFRSTTRRPPQYRKVVLEVSDLLRARLESLNEAGLSRELSPYLHHRQIEAILARRDLILREAEGTSP